MAPAKIIIDTDPGVDDVLAILFALASPDVQVELICSVFGNAHATNTFDNLIKMYYNLALELEASPEARERFATAAAHKPLIAVGEDKPIGGETHVATYFHGKDGLSNITQTAPEFTPPEGYRSDMVRVSDKKAYEAILELLEKEPEGTVTIVAIGPSSSENVVKLTPVTNVAWAYRSNPNMFARVKEVVWMGGALDVPGNTSPVAEFNSFADPFAFDMILGASKRGEFRLVFAPLDITTPHSVPFSQLLFPSAKPDSDRLKAFTTAFLKRVRGLQAQFGNPDAMEMHDPLAMWYAVANASRPNGALGHGWEVTPREFTIERTGERTRGMCVVDRRGTGEGTEIRTENQELQNLSAADEKEAREEGEAAIKKEEKEPEAMKHLPLMISKTPGEERLAQLLLERVWGVKA